MAEAVYSFHGGTNGILCCEDRVSWSFSELSEECEVIAAIRDNVRSVTFSSWHEECGDIWHHGRCTVCMIFCQLVDLIYRNA